MPADFTPAAARAQAQSTEQARLAGHEVRLAIVVADDGGAVLGACDLRLPDPSDPTHGEVAYLLMEDARGRGVATRAIWLIADWGFRALGMQRIQGMVHPGNARSAAVLERLGFRREALLRGYRPGVTGRGDRVVYAVLPGELNAAGGRG